MSKSEGVEAFDCSVLDFFFFFVDRWQQRVCDRSHAWLGMHALKRFRFPWRLQCFCGGTTGGSSELDELSDDACDSFFFGFDRLIGYDIGISCLMRGLMRGQGKHFVRVVVMERKRVMFVWSSG